MFPIDPDILFKAQQLLESGKTSDAEKEIVRSLLLVIRQQANELDALKRISVNLTSSLNLNTVLNTVAQEAIKLVKNAKNAHIFLYQNNQLKFGAALDASGKVNTQIADPRPEGLTATVARTGGIIIVEDMQKHPLFSTAPKNWAGSIIGIPLKMGSRVIGVMNLSRSNTGNFSREELRLLQLLADQASIAIINAELHMSMSKQAYSDILTGLPNRRALDEKLEAEVQRARRYNRPFAVVMMDLDGFKAINDTYGHNVGDRVLQRTFSLLGRNVRAVDFLARYGGDELTLILPEATLDAALATAQKLQSSLRRLLLEMPDGAKKSFDISGGIAVYPQHASTASDLLRAADTALYRAKRTARGTFLGARTDTTPVQTQTK